MIHNYEIEYKNVKLRQLEERDIESLRDWRNDSANTKYLRKIPFITWEMQRNWYHSYLNNLEEITFAVEEKETLRCLVGSLSLSNIEGGKAEVGKILIGEKRAHGKKVGVNALSAVLKIAKNTLDLREIYLYVSADNIPALKVYRETGFSIDDSYRDEENRLEYRMVVRLV
jgi:RimJ/RimL family protein N-acetyltransferase